MTTYEDKLNRDLQWALREGGMHFKHESEVHRTLDRISRKLDELGIDYAIVGGMALFFHGVRRFTEDVDILVTREGLQRTHAELEGRGYVPPFAGSKQLRDADTGVRVEFLVAGQYPGDGKPKAVAFPTPRDVAIVIEGVRCVGLPTLVELKIVSGITANRHWDLGDVQRLICELKLSRDFADQLNPSVREHFHDLWDKTQNMPEHP